MAQLKINDTDYALLRDIFLISHKAELYDRYQESGLSDTRYQWDMVWQAPEYMRNEFFNSAYEYLDDTHISSALRAIHNLAK